MSAPRKFDHDEARRLHAEGWTLVAIADKFGVSDTAVSRVTNPGYRARDDARVHARLWATRVPCVDCGKLTWHRYRRISLGRCRQCAGAARMESARPDALRCSVCRAWKPDEAFTPSSTATLVRRGRSSECKPCAAARRREQRARKRARVAA